MKNKKENEKKIYIIFITVMIVLYGAGYFLGRLVAKGEKSGSLDTILTFLKNNLIEIVPPLFLLLAVVSVIILMVFYVSCQKKYKKLQDNREDDDLWDALEEKLNQPMILANAMQIVNLFFFGCIICIAEFHSYGKNGGYEAIVLAVDVILVFLTLVLHLVVSRGIVEIEKSLNPEKRGNVFDFRFNEVWLESCDEAQKLITYKAGYAAFKNTNITCMVLWILTFIGMFIFKSGIYPLLCVCLIWLVNSLSYMVRAARLEKGESPFGA